MAKYASTEEGFKAFLQDYVNRGRPTPEPPHPFPNPMTSVVLEPEIEGEIIEDSFIALDAAECPDFFKFMISKKVVERVFAGGIEKFIDEDELFDEEINEPGKGDNEQGAHKKDVLYSTAEIANATAQAVFDVCEEWHKEPPKFDIPNLNIYSVHGIKNTRRKMEDKHTVITDLNTLLGLKDVSPTQYYAVFDGHGGLDASLYASKQLHITLARQESFKTDLEGALKKSILDLDNAYCKKSERDGSRSGTTAVATAIRDNVLYISWIGDSQGVLVRGGREFQLMEPHKPDRADEKKRIEDLGGCVIWFGAWRVNGTLSVSRAIGDPEFKPFVCGEADTSKAELIEDDDYLCIACDGFWDVFNGTQLAQMVSQHMKETGDKSSLSSVLCNKAKEAGSSDNITVLIVFLKDVISEFKEVETKTEEKVENEEPDANAESEKNEENTASMENSASEEKKVDDKHDDVAGDVIVQGSKLQPGIKERLPHRLFVNKPQSISSKVNVLVTDTAPHAKLPRSVITHKPQWQKSPIMERRDTRGSLFSLSTVESEEVTMPLALATENRLNISGLHTQSGFPSIAHPQRELRPSPARSTPSPSVMSEPVISGQSVISVHRPCKPAAAQKDSTSRRLYRTTIVMNQQFLDDGSDIGGFGYQRPKLLKRASRSVPDRLNRLSQMRQQSRWSDSQSQKRLSPTGTQKRLSPTGTRSFVRQPRNAYRKENIVPRGVPYYSYFDTKIAITNSLHNTIKPKQSVQKRVSSGSMRQSSQLPVHWHLRWIKN